MTRSQPETLTLAETAAAAARILDQLETVIVGKRPCLSLVVSGLLAGGHVLLEDVPGLGKTLIARSLAQVTGLDVGRVQFTPDLMPADVTGSMVFNQADRRFEFRPGPIFNNIVLGDEINRAPPKTQAAMLEAMAERQVTVDGHSHRLSQPFMVVATQNPVEFEGTYPLPEAQLDRFLLQTSIGYPAEEDEGEIIRRRLERRTDEVTLEPVVDQDTVVAMQQSMEDVEVHDSVVDYCVGLVRATRESPKVSAGASPRGVEALVKLARPTAVLAGRDFVTPDDVKHVAVPALAHRISMRPEQWVRGVGGDSVVHDCLDSVPAPETLPGTPPGTGPETPLSPDHYPAPASNHR